jgi:hypothetical protein
MQVLNTVTGDTVFETEFSSSKFFEKFTDIITPERNEILIAGSKKEVDKVAELIKREAMHPKGAFR